MLKRRLCFQLTVAVVLSFSFGLSYSSPVQDSPGYSPAEALKVMRLIEKIQLEQLEKGSDELRNVAVTESEFNSYIAYRIEVEKEEVMKDLRVKFFDDNRVECMVVVDLREQKLPKILKPRMTLFLGGELEVKDGNVRLNLEDLFLESQRIQPAVLDLVIFLGSKITGEESFSMSDWWVLPYGIKDIRTQKGEARFYY
jgi:hypothetical protein